MACAVVAVVVTASVATDVAVVVAVVVAVLAMAQDQPQVVLLPNEHDSFARFAEV